MGSTWSGTRAREDGAAARERSSRHAALDPFGGRALAAARTHRGQQRQLLQHGVCGLSLVNVAPWVDGHDFTSLGTRPAFCSAHGARFKGGRGV
jgi:hypothetical protein